MAFKVIDGGRGGSGGDATLAEAEFQRALRDMAANLLRVIRGAGKPYLLLKEMNDVIAAAVAYRDIAGTIPIEALEKALALELEVHKFDRRLDKGEIGQASIDRWTEDGIFDRMHAKDSIRRGVLQYVASDMLDQIPQRAAGEHEMMEGVRLLEEYRARLQERLAAERSAAVTSRKRVKRAPKSRMKDKPIES